MNYDIVIRNGSVFDGIGSAPVTADVAIKDNRIIEIGNISGAGVEELDAEGLFVTPGFIDIHSHSDFTLLVDPRAASSIFQGVTLEVIGNCGFGCAPISNPILAGNNIYGLNDEVPLTWNSMAQYLERLESASPAVNVLTLVPNGQLRLATIGMSESPATVEELGKMKYLLEAGIEEGAFGLSSGLEYPAEKTATEEELTELCRIVKRAGGIYATHTRKRDSGSVEAVEEAIRTAENSGVRLQISHLLPRSDQDECYKCVEVVDNALARGDDIAFDMHTRLFGTTYLSTVIPPWVMKEGRESLIRLLGDTQARKRMKDYESILSSGGDWKRIILLDNAFWPEYARMNIEDIARDRGQSALDTVYDLLQGAVDDLHALLVIIHCYKPNQQQHIFAHQLCMPGSDATTLAPDGPLAGSVFHGAYTWAAWFYHFMVKETGTLSPEAAIFKLTGLPASTLNLSDRGKLVPGCRADIAIFNPETFCEQGTTFEPNRLASGMIHVLVNGVITLRYGKLTESRKGEVLRF